MMLSAGVIDCGAKGYDEQLPKRSHDSSRPFWPSEHCRCNGSQVLRQDLVGRLAPFSDRNFIECLQAPEHEGVDTGIVHLGTCDDVGVFCSDFAAIFIGLTTAWWRSIASMRTASTTILSLLPTHFSLPGLQIARLSRIVGQQLQYQIRERPVLGLGCFSAAAFKNQSANSDLGSRQQSRSDPKGDPSPAGLGSWRLPGNSDQPGRAPTRKGSA
jgi:hypothetical protein